jgi:fucose permease
MAETLQRPMVWLSALLFFLFVGAEMSMGTWTYSLLTGSRGIDPAMAGFLTGSYWGTFTISRIIAGLFARRVSVDRLVQICLAGSVLSAVLYTWNPFPNSSVLAVALLGFFIAPLFPAFISGTSQRVGARFTTNTIGVQMAATGLATAVIPGMLGVLARNFSLEVIPICLVIIFIALIVSYLVTIKNHSKQEYTA